MSVRAVLGCMYGDEAKAKMVDFLAEEADLVVRFQGGSNAGHTIKSAGKKYVLHLVPSGILYPEKKCVISSGVVVDPFALLEEMQILQKDGISFKGRFFIDPRAVVILPLHKNLDSRSETSLGKNKIGTTGKGIGPGYADAISRVGIRMGDLIYPEFLQARLIALADFHGLEIDIAELTAKLLTAGEQLKEYFIQVPYLLATAQEKGESILFEGAQGTLLDVVFGTYPYVTSSHVIAGGIGAGAGYNPRGIDEIVGVFKSYYTRVGSGPFPTELTDETGNWIRERGNEYGATTGRPRRCGWFDAVSSRYSVILNGIDSIALTLLDVLSGLDNINICTSYKIDGVITQEFPSHISQFGVLEPQYLELPGWQEDISEIKDFSELPANARHYVETIEKLLGVRVKYISVGAERMQTILREY
ncbi:MAG: adenylosuccinate synthase [Candidatus Cloacimonetes bacterium]|nr:adenylosuccinate synthase [Candidatus Cloacimonadota bacterium]